MSTIIIQISIYITLCPILVGALRYKNLQKVQKWLLLMIVIIAVNQFAAKLWKSYSDVQNNLPFFHIYIVLELFFLSYIYKVYIDKDRFKNIAFVIFSIFAIFWCCVFFTGNNRWEYPAYTRFIESCIVLYFAASYFLKIFKDGQIVYLFNDSGFWVSIGIIVYFASNSLLFLFSEFVVTLSPQSFQIIWMIHAILVIFLYISYSIALRCK